MKLHFPVIALALCAACHRAHRDERPPEDEVWLAAQRFERGEARLAEARVQPIPQALASGGRIAFDDVRVAHVFSPVSGRVSRVLAQPGQRVRKGTPLAALVSPDLGNALADQVKANADRVAAEHEFSRQQKLFEAKAGSARDLQTAEDNFRKAQAEEQRAAQRVRLLHAGDVDAVTQEYLLRSPIDGRVVARTLNPGVEVQGQFSGGTAAELFTVGDIDEVWVYADVAESDVSKVAVGAQVAVRVVAYPEQIFRGRVEWISSVLDPALRTARIRGTLPNPEGLLKPEMYASVVVERPPLQALAVPGEALLRIGDQSFVYVPAGERPDGRRVFKRRRIQVPERSGPPRRPAPARAELALPHPEPSAPDLVPVLSSLAEGEQVLVDRLQPREAAADEVLLDARHLQSGKVATVAVEDREVGNAVAAGGRVAFEDARVSHVFSPLNGRVTRVLATPGQRVKKGDPLAFILSPDLGSAFSDELKARADLTAAEHERKRQREMFELHAGSRRDLETAEDNYQKAKAESDRAAQKSRLLRRGSFDEVTQQFILRAPIAGEVVARAANPGLEVQGQYTGGGSVVELFTVGSLDEVWVLADVYELDLSYVKPGAKVEVKVPSLSDRVFPATVEWISDTIDPVQRTAKIRCAVANPDHLLKPEMVAMASIAAPGRRSLTVPRESLLRLGDDTVVFVEGARGQDGQVAFRRQVVVADEQIAGARVPILGGLTADDKVAAAGSIFLLGLL